MEVVILIGLQGAGKTTFFQSRFAATHAWVSRDRFRNNPRPSRRQRELIEAALRDGRSVVVDNTSPTVAARAAIIEVARAFEARVVGYFFRPDVPGSIRRNALRPGPEQVPKVAILATAKRLVPPSYAEGFDALFEVHPTEGGGFEVQPL